MAEQLTLSEEQIRALRRRYPAAPDSSWVGKLAVRRGWREANVRYLQGEEKRSAAAMRALMRETGVTKVRSSGRALDLIALACEVFAPDSGFTGIVTRSSDHVLRIADLSCPVYREIESRGWRGVTACPSWHRRRGWLSALGVRASDTVLHEKKWGDPACVAMIEVSGRLAAPGAGA